MTKEESISMWKIEKAHADTRFFSKKMKKLYDLVEKKIFSGDLMYDQFGSDMMDEITTSIIDATKNESNLDRASQIDLICEKLYEKYTKQCDNSEPVEGDNGVSTDSTEVLDESRVHASVDTTEVGTEHTTETK